MPAYLEAAFWSAFPYMLGATAILCIVHSLQRRRHRHFGSYPFIAFAGFPIWFVLLGLLDRAIDPPTGASRHAALIVSQLFFGIMLAAVPFSLAANLFLFTQPKESRETKADRLER